jgi:mannosidase alpha-like ER degradation enhancer 2
MKLLFLLAFFLLLRLPSPAQTTSGTPNADSLAREVRKEFLHAWNAYKKYAWGHDGLRPISKTPYDWYSAPLYFTPLDALDTMILMGLKNEADSAREFLARNLRFDRDIFVKNFEITIRLLGGLLSSYQLTHDHRLLDLAEDLGKRLLPVFASPTGLPYVEVNLRTGAVRGTKTNPGEAGTLLVEFGTLSKLTGDPRYFRAAKNALLQTFKRRSPIGLVGDGLDVETGAWTGKDSHLSACIDSYYEYMVKGWLLFADEDCLVMWDSSWAAISRYLADTARGGLWYGHADMDSGRRTRTWFGALDAYFPAVLVLAGDTVRAGELQKSCVNMWNACGIEPEQFDYRAGKVVSPRFFLNPEIFESTYYLYRATGDPHYQAMGQALFDSLKAYCRLPEGYCELKSVITKERADRMESYFFAETLKYLYLLFAPSQTLPFNEIIFNTEAHPIKRIWREVHEQ